MSSSSNSWFSPFIFCLALTAEQWFAIMRPKKYCVYFNKKRSILHIVSSWVWSFALTCSGIIEKGYNPSSNTICEHRFYLKGSLFRLFLGIFQVTMEMFLSCLLVIGLYIHMTAKVSKSPVASADSKAKLRGKMTRMIAAATVLLVICFAPGQTYLVLAWQEKRRWTLRNIMLSFFSPSSTAVLIRFFTG